MDEKSRQYEVGRVFRWFAENPKMVELIRCEDGVVDTHQAIEVLEKLRDDHTDIPIIQTADGTGTKSVVVGPVHSWSRMTSATLMPISVNPGRHLILRRRVIFGSMPHARRILHGMLCASGTPKK